MIRGRPTETRIGVNRRKPKSLWGFHKGGILEPRPTEVGDFIQRGSSIRSNEGGNYINEIAVEELEWGNYNKRFYSEGLFPEGTGQTDFVVCIKT